MARSLPTGLSPVSLALTSVMCLAALGIGVYWVVADATFLQNVYGWSQAAFTPLVYVRVWRHAARFLLQVVF